MAETLTLYTNPWSRGAIARWMLEEVGEPYALVPVKFDADRPADLIEANPMGKLPTLVHGSRVVTEAAAVCAYLADTFPTAGLAPDPSARDGYYRWLFFAAGPLEQAATSKAVGWEPSDERQKGMLGFGDYDRTVQTLETAVKAALDGPGWLTGDRFTACDLYVGAHLSWGTGFGTLPRSEPFLAFVEKVNARPAAQRAQALDGELAVEMGLVPAPGSEA